jgi:predicted PolB exonuclease-like 3'-5' exonuclease
MNDRIRNLDPEKLLFFDAETISRHKELDINSKEFELFQWKNRDKVTDKLLPDNEVIKLYLKKAALSPEFNKLACISVGYIVGDTFYYKSLIGSNKEITEQFFTMLSSGKFITCSWNGIAFDIPVIRIKAYESGCEVELLDKYNDSEKKPWNITAAHCDLMDVFKGTHYYPMSLDAACMISNVESPKTDLKGSEVTAEFYKNGVKKVASYCNEDVKALARIFCRLIGEPDKIKNYINKSGTVLEITEPTVVEKIKNTGKLLKRDVDKILKTFKDNTLEERADILKSIEAILLLNSNITKIRKTKQYQYLKEEILKENKE